MCGSGLAGQVGGGASLLHRCDMLGVQLSDRCVVHQELLRDLAQLLSILLALGGGIVADLLAREEVRLNTRVGRSFLGGDLRSLACRLAR